MVYRIAVVSSDGEEVNLSFGEATFFRIYRVSGTKVEMEEMRRCPLKTQASCVGQEVSPGGCGGGAGNGEGCGGVAYGKTELLADCRCLICRKAGFRIIKQLEKRAVSVFDVQCPVKEALEKIAAYYECLDTHQPLQRRAGREEET